MLQEAFEAYERQNDELDVANQKNDDMQREIDEKV